MFILIYFINKIPKRQNKEDNDLIMMKNTTKTMKLRSSASVFSLTKVFDKGTSSIGFFANRHHNSNAYVTVESKDGKHYSEHFITLSHEEGKRSVDQTVEVLYSNHTGHKYSLPKYVKKFVSDYTWKIEDDEKEVGLKDVDSASFKMGEGNDCTVKAVALATGVTYEEAHAACKIEGRRDGYGISYFPILRAIERCGGKIISQANRYEFRTGGVNSKVDYQKVRKDESIMTVKRLAKKLGARQLTFNRLPEVIRRDRNYIVMNEGHAAAVVDGKIIDWSANRKMYVTELIEIAK